MIFIIKWRNLLHLKHERLFVMQLSRVGASTTINNYMNNVSMQKLASLRQQQKK